ncbi:hypothetical protein AC249_AIPGENE6460 [Exaiptasia diaphana]|nr:hypothetical protein AC249_AIPGENE6460 [Exaiptasia diaphana]
MVEVTGNKELVNELKTGVIQRYMNMASSQFLRDFRRAYNLKKSAEHRKRVLQKQQVASVKRDHVSYNEIVKDKSEGKKISHSRLFSFVNQYKSDGIQKVYKKPALINLCKAYGVTTHSKDNKKKLASALAEMVLSQADTVIPQTCNQSKAIQISVGKMLF